MPIPLGILAVAGAGAAGAYELIESVILTGSQSSVTFSNLGNYSSTYKHLQIRYTARSAGAGESESLKLRFNGDSGNNYAIHQLYGNGSSVVSGNSSSLNYTPGIGYMAASTAASNVFGAGVADILDAFSSSKNKTLRSLSGINGSTSYILLRSGLWVSTSSITSISLEAESAANLVSGSRFSLYGIKG